LREENSSDYRLRYDKRERKSYDSDFKKKKLGALKVCLECGGKKIRSIESFVKRNRRLCVIC